MNIGDVVIKPVITEKALRNENEYVFEVARWANKQQIKAAVEMLYEVEVGEVNTLIQRGKTKRVGKKRLEKRRPSVKKAYIKITKGEIPDVKVQ